MAKLDIEKALIEKGYQNKDGSFSMLSKHFEAGANYALEQLNKTLAEKDVRIQELEQQLNNIIDYLDSYTLPDDHPIELARQYLKSRGE